MSDYTPGPWAVKQSYANTADNGDRTEGLVVEADGKHVALICLETKADGSPRYGFSAPADEVGANADLIAAAPALLEAAEAASCKTPNCTDPVCVNLRAAIRQARGGQ